jgi:lipopolysaccharide biosynthesis protein
MSKECKLLAFYLPQFHCFKENDEWWGKGFTEWTNVKKAEKLFASHNQPRVPYENDYYNLLEEGVLERQMKLAEEYGVYGFCYYHYWFNGKLLMEKPLERMLTLDKKLPYCFCWANEPWTRAWDGKTGQVIMPQEYGEEPEWEEHFLYLLSFFKDSYYIKKDGKPVLVIYRANNVEKYSRMIEYLKNRSIEEGLSGLYVIEENNSFQFGKYSDASDAILDFEPMCSLNHNRSIVQRAYDKLYTKIFNKITKNNLLVYDYDKLWKNIIRCGKKNKGKSYLGAFVDWDNTARKGKKGMVIKGATPEKFKKYLTMQMENAKNNNSEFVFINAWNEWAEGTYLEADEKYGYKYLEAIRDVVGKK